MTILKIIIICTCSIIAGTAQTPYFLSLKGHSHNDYYQKQPFTTAYESGMGSIEADVFLRNKSLYVAHTFFEIDKSCTFDALYIQPIVFAVREKCLEQLQLMIDIKTEGESTLNEIIRLLARYPDVFNDRSPVQLVISGNRPAPSVWRNYPRYIRFDGRPYENYTDEQWERIAVVSDNFNRYAGWLTYSIDMPIAAKLKSVIDAVHRRGKKIRFWKTPDNEWAWENLLNLGVDFINTDKPQQLKSFFDKKTSLTTTYISAYYEHNNKRLFK